MWTPRRAREVRVTNDKLVVGSLRQRRRESLTDQMRRLVLS